MTEAEFGTIVAEVQQRGYASLVSLCQRIFGETFSRRRRACREILDELVRRFSEEGSPIGVISETDLREYGLADFVVYSKDWAVQNARERVQSVAGLIVLDLVNRIREQEVYYHAPSKSNPLGLPDFARLTELGYGLVIGFDDWSRINASYDKILFRCEALNNFQRAIELKENYASLEEQKEKLILSAEGGYEPAIRLLRAVQAQEEAVKRESMALSPSERLVRAITGEDLRKLAEIDIPYLEIMTLEEKLAMTVPLLGLPKRTCERLKAEGIRTIGDLVRITAADLVAIRGLDNALRNVSDRLAANGLELAK